MNWNIKKEWYFILIVMAPFIYLACIWGDLPAEVPLHWNIDGEIDRWGSKKELLMMPFLLPFLSYLIFLLVPFIDPKKKIQKMGAKYRQLKLIFVLFTSILAVLIIYASHHQSAIPLTYVIFILIGLFISLVGNYFQTIKPNYFIGIRTPWTLEFEENWIETHKMAGKLWFGGGIMIAIIGFLLRNNQHELFIFFYIIIGILVVFPIGYSYYLYRKMEE